MSTIIHGTNLEHDALTVSQTRVPSSNNDVLVFSGGYLIRVEVSGPTCACIHAESVPPSVVGEMLRSTGAGVLRDYDEAMLFVDWRDRLQLGAPGLVEQPALFSAKVRY